MAQTVIPFGSAQAVKKWGPGLSVMTDREAYFTRKFEGEGKNNIIEVKKDLESDAGDTVVFDLAIELKEAPVEGDNRVSGTGENMKFFQDEVRIDQVRKEVSAGGRMTRKRTIHNLRQNGMDLQKRYWAKFMDEVRFIYLSGARGHNEGYIPPLGWTGRAGNPIQPPDAGHIIRGGYRASSALITAGDIMTRVLVEGITTRVKMMREQDPNNADMVPVTIEGEPHFVLLMNPNQAHDLRVSDTDGWIKMQTAAAAAEGQKNPLFKGKLGMINNVILHEHESVVRFTDYGVGANIQAARALFMGRQAGVVAYGMAGRGARYDWVEEKRDGGNEHIIIAGTITGMKKTRYNGRDFGVVAVDTAAKSPGT